MSQLVKNSIIYTSFTVLQKAIGFFMLPIYTAFLSPEDYGIANLVFSITSFLSLFYLLSLNGGLVRFYHDTENSIRGVKELLGTVFYSVLAISTILSTILLLSSNIIFPPILGKVPFYPYMFIGMISITFEPIYQIGQSILQVQQKGKVFALVSFSRFLLTLGLNLLFVLGLHYKAESFLLSTAIANTVFFILTVIAFLKTYGFAFNYRLLKKLLKYSVPLLPHTISGWTMTMIDRVLISRILTVAATGLYSIGFQLSNILSIIINSFTRAYSPFFFQQIKKGEEGRRNIVNVSTTMVILFSIIGMFFSLFSKEVITIMASKEYIEGYIVVPYLTYTFVFQSVYIFVAGPLLISSTHIYSTVSVFGAILNVILNLLLIPIMGYHGAALASLLQRIISTILYAFLGFKRDPLPFRWNILFGMPAITFLISISVLYLLSDFNIFLSILIKCLVIVSTFLVTYLTFNTFSNSVNTLINKGITIINARVK